jgi:hypothetical protein
VEDDEKGRSLDTKSKSSGIEAPKEDIYTKIAEGIVQREDGFVRAKKIDHKLDTSS